MNQKNNIRIKKILYDEYKSLNFNHEFSYLQSWDYGEMKSNLESINVYRYLIYNTNNVIIGYFQMLTVEFLNFIIYARINRGPVLFQNTYSEEEIIIMIKNHFIKKFVLVFDIAPNIKSSSYNFFIKNGFLKKTITPWGSSIINLSNNSEFLFKNLDSKWRNAMLKSEKNNVKFILCNFENEYFSIKNMYEDLQKKNNFVGLSSKMLKYISNKNNFKEICFDVYAAYIDHSQNKIGYIIILNNLHTSTYLLGVTNDIGRKFNVNSFLLWNSLLESKKKGKMYFDTGGMNADTPLGIFKFKDGLNGEKYDLIGEFRFFQFIGNVISFFYSLYKNG